MEDRYDSDGNEEIGSLATVGPKHNKPPQMIDVVREVAHHLSTWFADNPAVSTEQEAREIKLQIDRAKLCLQDLEAERDSKVRPLNDKVDTINAMHKSARKPLGAVLDEMEGALNVFIKAEEARRVETAVEAKRKAQEAEQKARSAEKLERERLECIRLGEIGLDLASITAEADAAFDEYERAQRAAIRAQADTRVKIAGGFSRAITLKEKEILDVENVNEALIELGLTANIKQAILTSARAFRKKHGRLPAGITVTIDRHI